MPSGLTALLDDVAGIAKLAAASLDDVGAAAGKASSKAAGVVIDDTAVTPCYVVGFTPDRELPIIWKIALGSLRNKLVLLLPAALLLSAFAPWAITPLLMAGGAYLCFEGAEKLIEALSGETHEPETPEEIESAAHLEQEKVSGAIRTDLILSAEIMAIALADVSTEPFVTRAVVLAVVGMLVTVGVYGVVALIVKMDDIGLHLAKRGSRPVQALGRGLVKGMPHLLSALSIVGTAAMVWVGGGIVLHGLEQFGMGALPHMLHHWAVAAGHAAPAIGGGIEWLVSATGSGIFGLILGSAIAFAVHRFARSH
jgi:predicted DNA repair protein MutK